LALFTNVETGYAFTSPAGYGTSIPASFSASPNSGIQPRLVALPGQDHRHPVMDRRDHLVGRTRDDREGLELRAVRPSPPVPQPREPKRPLVLRHDPHRLLGLGPRPLLPFVKKSTPSPFPRWAPPCDQQRRSSAKVLRLGHPQRV